MEKEENTTNQPTGSPIKMVTYIVLGISALLLVWYILSDRYVPYTDQAKVNGLTTPIAPRVSGYITEINVRLHDYVHTGDTLFRIDPRPYLLAVEQAEANLDNTGQSVAARTASVKSSAGRLGVARAQLDRAQRNWDRVQKVLKENPGALSQSDRDQAETSLMQATEQVASAEADLERSQQSLGVSGERNPKFIGALKALEKAQLDLAFTHVIATADGYVESLSIDQGYYASPGQPLATLVSKENLWIQADMKENNLSRMKVGDQVEFILDVKPGKVFSATVRSIGHGVTTGNATKGDLPSISSSQGWLRDPQRFPVIISFDVHELETELRLGGQSDVVVFTGDGGILNATGKLRIRVMSWLSYLR
ncbi:HlyD family secretion protein [Limibacter armeniacum]|uniref:HlyD family secretion protein n=1 Tax=Limibacter armeniacum TaxID=466084 RepID=UPI002FE69B57